MSPFPFGFQRTYYRMANRSGCERHWTRSERNEVASRKKNHSSTSHRLVSYHSPYSWNSRHTSLLSVPPGDSSLRTLAHAPLAYNVLSSLFSQVQLYSSFSSWLGITCYEKLPMPTCPPCQVCSGGSSSFSSTTLNTTVISHFCRHFVGIFKH